MISTSFLHSPGIGLFSVKLLTNSMFLKDIMDIKMKC